MKDDRLYLDHILERIELIQQFTSDGRNTLFDSALVREAVLRCLEIMGEAARKASDDLHQQNPQIPWSKMIAFRNVLIHNYPGIDLEEVWRVIENDLPPLKPEITALIQKLDEL